MFLTDEDVSFLLRNGVWILSLALCLILLLVPKFRTRANPFAWIAAGNLLAGALWYGQFPLAMAMEARFQATDPGYAAAALPFDGSSVYINTPRDMRFAAYSCYGGYSSFCEMPVSDMLREGQVEFVEIRLNDRLVRYSIAVHDPQCLDWQTGTQPSFLEEPFILQDRWVSPGLAACVIKEDIDRITATHDITISKNTMGWPSRRQYYSVQLRNRASGQVLDQFDGWFGADPYLSFDPPRNARRPVAVLGQLLMIRPSRTRYDPAIDDQLLAVYGVDEGLLVAAMTSPYQALRARSLWMACRDEVVATLSATTRNALRDASRSDFGSESNFLYPESCPDFTR